MSKTVQLPESPRVLVFVTEESAADALARLPFLRALRFAFPTGQVNWMVGRGGSAYRGELAPLAKGLIDGLLDTVELRGRLAELFVTPLRGERFDLTIDTQRRLMTSLVLKRIPSGRFISASADFLLSDARPAKSYVAPPSETAQLVELVALASATPAKPASPLMLGEPVRAAARALLPRGPTYIGLAPGAGALDHAWPVNEYVNIARVLAQNDNVPVFLLGAPEAHWHDPIAAAVPTARFPMQHPSVSAIGLAPHFCIALAERLGVTVVNDGPISHMVAAAGTPMVGLFGPTDPARATPFGARVVVLRAQSWGGPEMALIPASAVLQAIQKVLWPGDRSRAS